MVPLAFIENISFGEFLVLLIVVVLILGPSAARRAGRFVGGTSTGGGAKPQTPPSSPAPPTSAVTAFDELYRALDLPPGASIEQIRAAYKELVKVWHPDRFGKDEKLRERATQKLQQINAAYEKLCQAHDTHSQK